VCAPRRGGAAILSDYFFRDARANFAGDSALTMRAMKGSGIVPANPASYWTTKCDSPGSAEAITKEHVAERSAQVDSWRLPHSPSVSSCSPKAAGETGCGSRPPRASLNVGNSFTQPRCWPQNRAFHSNPSLRKDLCAAPSTREMGPSPPRIGAKLTELSHTSRLHRQSGGGPTSPSTRY